MPGRPSKRTPATEKRILESLRAGNTRTASAGYGGISKDTFYEWLKEFPDFSDAVKKAESDCEVAFVAVIKKAATGHPVEKTVTKTRIVGGVSETETTTTRYTEYSWQAGAWWLERRKPEDYARFVLDPTKLSPEQVAEIMRLASGGDPAGDGAAGGR